MATASKRFSFLLYMPLAGYQIPRVRPKAHINMCNTRQTQSIISYVHIWVYIHVIITIKKEQDTNRVERKDWERTGRVQSPSECC